MSERRRASLTPLESELRFPDTVQPQAPSAWRRTRRRLRRERRPPKTLLGAVAGGILRLGVAVTFAAALALLVDHWWHRTTALGFYIVGGALLAVAMGLSGGTGRRYYTDQFDRERRVSTSFSYIAAGLVVIAIGVAIEATR
jgi:MFS family permease